MVFSNIRCFHLGSPEEVIQFDDGNAQIFQMAWGKTTVFLHGKPRGGKPITIRLMETYSPANLHI